MGPSLSPPLDAPVEWLAASPAAYALIMLLRWGWHPYTYSYLLVVLRSLCAHLRLLSSIPSAATSFPTLDGVLIVFFLTPLLPSHQALRCDHIEDTFPAHTCFEGGFLFGYLFFQKMSTLHQHWAYVWIPLFGAAVWFGRLQTSSSKSRGNTDSYTIQEPCSPCSSLTWRKAGLTTLQKTAA